MLTYDNKTLLERFYKYSRDSEELFARMLSENHELRLFYNNGGEAYTDGETIVVDPSMWELFADKEKLRKIGDYLNWPESILADKENALMIITRFQTIHECLHLIYTDFPLPVAKDPLPKNNLERKVLASIANIIEDAYIELAGCIAYDNMKFYLQFGRVSAVFAEKDSHKESHVQKEERIKSLSGNEKKAALINAYLNHVISEVLYPMADKDEPLAELVPYFNKTLPLFKEGCVAISGTERYKIAQEIFLAIKPLLPDVSESSQSSDSSNDKDSSAESSSPTATDSIPLPKLNGDKTHAPCNNARPHKGRAFEIARPFHSAAMENGAKNEADKIKEKSPFELLENELKKEDEENLGMDLFGCAEADESIENKVNQAIARDMNTPAFSAEEIRAFINELNTLKEEIRKEALSEKQDTHITISAGTFKGSTSHKGITIDEFHPAIDKSLKPAYEKVYKKFKSSIGSYAGRFLDLIKTTRTVKERGFTFGSGIVSSRLGDSKKRFWYRNETDFDTPDLAVLVLIDGSGSMSGEKCTRACQSAVILHEVLAKQNIPHSIIEHNAPGATTKINIKILLDFFAKKDDRLNIMRIGADYCNRDGLALLWAEKHLNKVQAETRLLIVISDGQPYHPTRNEINEYRGKKAIEDTKNIVKQISRHGTKVIGIALDDSSCTCFDTLKAIYPNLLKCDNIKELPKKLLGVISDVI